MIVEEYRCDQLKFISEPDSGMYDALNKALGIYTGDAFGVLNSDDRYHSTGVLSAIAEELRKYDMVHGHVNYVNNHEDSRTLRFWRATDPPKSGFRSGWMPNHTSFYVRREVQEATGPFSLEYKISSDYDWMLRAIECGKWRLSTLDLVITDMQNGGASTSGIRRYIRHNIESLRSRRVHLGSGLVDTALLQKPMRKLQQFSGMSAIWGRNNDK